MKKNLLLFTALIAAGFGYAYYNDRNAPAGSASSAQDQSTKTNIEAADFTFTDMAGKKHSLSDFQGKAVVLNFWASWCAPCVIEFPQMLKLAKGHEDNAVFLFLSEDDSMEDIKKFLKKYGKSLPKKNVFVAHDKDQSIARTLYQTYKLPETYLIDSSGFVQDKIIGADIDWNSADMNEKIEELSR